MPLLPMIAGSSMILIGRDKRFSRMVCLLVCKVFILLWFIVLLSKSRLPFLCLTPPVLALLFPAFFLRLVIVPRGWGRVAYWLARIGCPLDVCTNIPAGATIHAALAFLRGGASPADIEWLKRRLTEERQPSLLWGMGAALIALLSQDRMTARAIFQICDTYRGRGRMQEIARDWLIRDAVRRADWTDLIRRGKRGAQSYPWSYAVACSVEKIRGDPAARPNWQLRLLWLLTPRLRFRSLLKRALAAPREAVSADASSFGDLPAALANLAVILERKKALRWSAPCDLGAALDAVETHLASVAVRERISQRLAALDTFRTPDEDGVIGEIRREVAGLLVPLLERMPWRGARTGLIMRDAIAQIRRSTLQTIDLLCRDYTQRTRQESFFDPLTEWRNWAGCLDAADRLLRLCPEDKHLLFSLMARPVNEFAVRQYNLKKNRLLSYAMWSWLSRGAPPAADTRHLVKNLKTARMIR